MFTNHERGTDLLTCDDLFDDPEAAVEAGEHEMSELSRPITARKSGLDRLNPFERSLIKAELMLKRFATCVRDGRGNRLIANADIEDVTSATLCKAWEIRETFTPGSNMQAWLRKIMKLIAQDQHKKLDSRTFREALRQSDLGGVDDDGNENSRDQFEDYLATPGAQESFMTAREMFDAVLKNPAADLLINAGTGASLKGLAAMFNLPINTVRSRLRRGRLQLLATGVLA